MCVYEGLFIQCPDFFNSEYLGSEIWHWQYTRHGSSNEWEETFDSLFLRFVSRESQVDDLFYSKIKLTDENGVDQPYKRAAVLLINRYSDTIHIIKHEGGHSTQYTGETYSEGLRLSNKFEDGIWYLWTHSGFLPSGTHQDLST